VDDILHKFFVQREINHAW